MKIKLFDGQRKIDSSDLAGALSLFMSYSYVAKATSTPILFL